ncbi:GNAT family N-acetyltransferase [Dyella tabacisoli]|uniref:N-acetyltransferase n=1 Tax=Dyella tabacisoli TaxID=2282381 RepID=A0A369UQN2_9GAMM|nr:GNAT family N-acetyltransferase [Dyella tabacisoli]RDD82365.1 N-acetyltransferase [Dyella tabacisoli]
MGVSSDSMLVFRPAHSGDVGLAVPLIHSSGPAAFDYVFTVPGRGGAQDFLRYAFLDGAGEFGWRNHWVGEQGGQVVAVGAGYGGHTHWPFTLAAARQILGFYGIRHAGGVMARGLRVEAVIPPPSGAMHYLGHLGVAAQWRGHGIGQALIERLMAEGRAQGRQRMVLDVAASNPRAEALYARCGFAVTGERRSALANAQGQVPDHHRMERQLD